MIHFFERYFNANEILNSETASIEEKKFAKISFASYFAIIPPIIFAIGYAITCIISKFNHKVSIPTESDPEKTRTEAIGLSVLSQNYDSATEKPQEPASFTKDFFVKLINAGGYITKNGKSVTLKSVENPEMFVRSRDECKQELELLRTQFPTIDPTKKPVISFEDKTTEIAINDSQAGRIIALNFANEFNAGGGPGVYKDEHGQLVFYSLSAHAQEESLCQHSTLLRSLLMIPHEGQHKIGRGYRNEYNESLDSANRAVITHDTLFAIQETDPTILGEHKNKWHFSKYLDTPKEVTFITSAAYSYSSMKVDCAINSKVYEDAKRRMETHLLAAAKDAAEFKTQNPDQTTDLILGAFGCGAFVPGNKKEYREMIADIYFELLPQFDGFFDKVTFAVPSLYEKPNPDSDSNIVVFRDAVRKYEETTSL